MSQVHTRDATSSRAGRSALVAVLVLSSGLTESCSCSSDGDSAVDTAPPVEDSNGEETASPATRLDHVMVTFQVAERGDGIDLDGDGALDNAVWSLAAGIDPVLAQARDISTQALVLQVSGLEDMASLTAAVRLALLSAQPVSEGAWSGGVAVDDDGLALVAVDTELVDGAHETILLDDTLTIGALTLEASTPIHVHGTVDADQHSGLIGLGIGTDVLIAALAQAGSTEGAAVIAQSADLDTDGDGEEDAISMAFAFTAERCTLTN